MSAEAKTIIKTDLINENKEPLNSIVTHVQIEKEEDREVVYIGLENLIDNIFIGSTEAEIEENELEDYTNMYVGMWLNRFNTTCLYFNAEEAIDIGVKLIQLGRDIQNCESEMFEEEIN